ncbi:MAG TPA: hypothetical protein VF175_11210 [Lacipirellula sp.]
MRPLSLIAILLVPVGCTAEVPTAAPIMTQSAHNHYHVHAADASHGHDHDGARLGHNHSHSHD